MLIYVKIWHDNNMIKENLVLIPVPFFLVSNSNSLQFVEHQ